MPGSGRRKKSLLFMIENQSLWLTEPMVSSKVMALMLREARMASLSARVGSSLEGTLAERMTHMSHRFTFTALRSARLRGEP